MSKWKERLGITINDLGNGHKRWKSKYVSVNRLLERLEMYRSDSEASKEHICGTVCRLCSRTGMDPDQLVERPEDEVKAALLEFRKELNDLGGRPRSANQPTIWLKTFFAANGMVLDIPSLSVPSRSRTRDEYVPTVEELLRMADAWPRRSRNRAMVLFLGLAGPRNSTFRALRYGDIRDEFERGVRTLMIPIREKMKQYVPCAAKGRLEYETFALSIVTEVLREYLEDRVAAFGPIQDEDPLFSSQWTRIKDRRRRNRATMSRGEVQHVVKESARRAGLSRWKAVHPHSLRHTFTMFLANQPSDFSLDPAYQFYFAGHKLPGSQDSYFDRNPEHLRIVFERLEGSLDPEARLVRRLAAELGVNLEVERSRQISELGRDPSSSEQKKHLRKVISDKRKGIVRERKFIKRAELNSYLFDGWEPVFELGDGGLVVSRPNLD
ncbi:MAG: site-specific integrase [Thaumarchaeota archaeon]|nr:site-specific integrase [Nitrososphaerota archaeon]